MTNNKFRKKHQDIYNEFKDHHKADDYEIEWIDEIFLPFWSCKQIVYVQTEIKLNEFSTILLQLIDNEIKKRNEICEFLGVGKDDFTFVQLDYLMNNGYIEEDNLIYYEITHEGRNFLKGTNKESHIETTEIDYIVSEIEHITEEKYETFFNDLKQEFFDKNKSIDSDSKQTFSGYKAIETHKLKVDNKIPPNHIKHGDKPTVNKIKNSNFVEFFNSNHNDCFYDFNEEKSIEAHKRSMKFSFIYYVNQDKEPKIEVRHCSDTVNKFDKKKRILE